MLHLSGSNTMHKKDKDSKLVLYTRLQCTATMELQIE